MKRPARVFLLGFVLILTAVLALKGASLLIPSGTWQATGSISPARANAAAALLEDGRILVTGGDAASGPAATSEFFQTDGTVVPAPAMADPRSGHYAVALPDGRVLVGGGVTAGGSTTSTAELFDPAANAWSATAQAMIEARAGATATLLPDGRVVVAGGHNGTAVSSTIEIFNPVTGTFSVAGVMSSPRFRHAMTVLLDGRVLIVGGFTGTAAVATSDIFDPTAGTVTPGPVLNTARFGHTATTLMHGAVVVVGGNNGNADPAQMDVTATELFDPSAATPAFVALSAVPATPREGHLAILLPNNNSILIAGGSSAAAAVANAELFTPQVSTQGVWSYGFAPTSSMSSARNGAAAAANQVSTASITMKRNGVVTIAGGTDAGGNTLSSTESYGFPTVQTDASDYTPGSTVTVTGSGFAPNELVAIQLLEYPLIDTHGPYTVQADSNGSFSDSSFTTDAHDLDVRFYLAATGTTSGFQAQNLFADAQNDGSGNMAVSPATAVAGSSSNSFLFTFATDQGKDLASGAQVTVQVPAGWTAPQNTNSGNPGFVSVANVSCATAPTIASVSSGLITININCLKGAQSFTLSYAGGASKVTAPAAAGPYTFTTQTKQNGGTLANIQVEPAVTLTPGPATKLAFSVSPSNTAAGSAITPGVRVQILDANNNVVTTNSSTVSITISAGGAFTGTSTTSVAAVNGTATFSNLVPTTVGTGFTLNATDGALAGATSGSFNVTAGTAAKLAFLQQPTTTTAGIAINPAVTVQIQDQFGNATGSTATVTIGGGGTLSGASTTSVAAVNGTATFSNLVPTQAGSFTLSAASAGLSGATSTSFTVNGGTANKLAFAQQPATTAAGNAINPAVTVQIQDQFGNATGSTATVTIGGGGTLSGASTTSVAAVNGTATFSNLVPTQAGSFTLSAASAGLSGATSTSFTVNGGTANKLAFAQQPTTTAAGSAINPAVTVQVQDQFGNQTASTATVTIGGGGTLTGTTSAAAVNGLVTFSNLIPTQPGSFTLAASSTGLAGAASNSFTVTAPDLTATKTNSVSGATSVGNTWTWTIQVSNIGNGAANYTQNNQIILTDNMPNTSITYSGLATGNFVGVSNPNQIACSITAGTLACIQAGNGNLVSIAAGGSFTVQITATPAAAGTFANPVSGGSCVVDPNNNIGESSLANNSCSDVVIVSAANTSTTIASTGAASGVVGQPVTVNFKVANISGAAVAPTGTVTVNDQTGASCSGALTAGAGGVSTGSCNLTPLTTGSKTLVASYPASTSFNASSSSGTAYNVTARSTSTSVAFATNPDIIGQPTTATVTVTDTAGAGASNPGGTIGLTPTGHGGFSGACTLTQGANPAGTVSCQVSYTPSDSTTPQNIAATYTPNDNVHATSSGGSNLNVTARSTSTAVAFGANPVVVGNATSVTVTVTDTAGTGAANPGGAISFTPTGHGSFSGACTLAPNGNPAGTVSCQLSYTPSDTTTPQNIAATYTSTDNIHSGSSGSANLTVTGTPPTITSAAGTTFTAGAAGTFTVTTSGTPTAVLSAPAPAGITFTDNGNGTATVAGTLFTAGSYSFTITAQNGVPPNATQLFTITVVANAPATITVVSGSGQSGTVGTQFANPLVAQVQDLYANPVPSAQVTFSAPASGASGTFAGGVNTATTNAGGQATSAAFTANTLAGSYSVVGSVMGIGSTAIFSLSNTAGDPARLQILLPGETAAPGTVTGKTGTPDIQYVNGAFNATVNAVDAYFNAVPAVTDSVAISSNDPKAILPGAAALVNGTGTFSVTLETVSNPAATTLTATDQNNASITADTSAPMEVIIVYTAVIAPSMTGTGVATDYTLTIANSAAPNSNNLSSVTVAVPPAEQGTVTNVSVAATQQGGPAVSWIYDSAQMPGVLRFHANSANDAVTPGGAITITFTATSSASISNTPVSETWTTVAYSAGALPLAPPEPAVKIGQVPAITSAPSTTAFAYGTAGTIFTVTSTGVPTPVLSQTGAPAWVDFKDNQDGTATISGTPTSAANFNFSITAHNGFGPDATQNFSLQVQKANAVVSVTPYHVTYDADAHTATGTATGVGGVDLSAYLDLTHTTHTAAGVYSSDSWTFTDPAGNYNNQGPTTITDEIEQATATISVTPYQATYNGDAHTATGSATGVKNADLSGGLNLSGTTHTNAGSYSDPWTFHDPNGNYKDASGNAADKIDQAPLTVTANSTNKNYGVTLTFAGTEFLLSSGTLYQNDKINSVTLTSAGAAGTATVTAPGPNYPIIPTAAVGSGLANYIIGYSNGTLTVLPAQVTASVTAADKFFDGTTSATINSCTVPGKLNSDDVACSVAAGNASFASANASGAKQLVTATNITLTGSTAGNYALSPATATAYALIKPVETATAVASSLNPAQYGQAVIFTATVSNTSGTGVTPTGFVQFVVDGGNFGSPVAVVNGSASSPATTALGVSGSPHSVTANYTNADGNFAPGSGSLSGGQATSPAPLAITASSGTFVYGSASPVMVGPLFIGPGNFVNGEGPGALTVQPSCGPMFSSATPAGTYVTTCSGAMSSNYAISFLPGSVIVSPAATATTLTTSPNPSNWTNVVTLTATVTNAGGTPALPAGNVSFYNAASGATCASPGSSTLIDSVPLNLMSPDAATTTTPKLPVGTDNILACFNYNSADPNYSANFVASSGSAAQMVRSAPIVTLSPSTLSFGNQQGGTTSAAQTITVCNGPSGVLPTDPCISAPVSTDVLAISSIQFTNANTSPVYFVQTNTCPNGSNTVPLNGSCAINVKFQPAANSSGIASALLTVTDNDANVQGSTQSAGLTGAGTSSISGVGSLSTFGLFATANGCSSLTMSGNGTEDGYNGPANSGNVGTNGNVALNGNPVINGAVYSPNSGTGGCSSKAVTGLATSGKAQATGGLKALSSPITYFAPPVVSPAPPTTGQSINGSCPSGMAGCSSNGSKNVNLAPGTYGNVSANGGTTANLSKGTYNFNTLTLTGSSVLVVSSGPVVINIAGGSLNTSATALDLSGGSIVNSTGVTSNVLVNYPGSNPIKLSGGTQMYALIYAPNAPVNMTGGSHFYGSIVGNTINSSGNTAIHDDQGLPAIAGNNYIWFSSSGFNVQGLPGTGTVKLYITNASISFTAIDGPHTVAVPNAVITFSSTVTSATTTWDASANRWSTLVPTSSVSGNATIRTFFDGVAFPVPAGGFPGGIQNVSWQAAFTTSTPTIKFNWQFEAAVYSSFTATGATGNYTGAAINPLDNADPAGTPGASKNSLVFGNTGAGYVGMPQGAAAVVPTIAPMSISPSSYDFGSVTRNSTATPAAGTSFVLTNSDSVPYTISSISITGTYSADFAMQAGVNNCLSLVGSALGPGASCMLYPSFTPTAAVGSKETAKVVINDSAANSPQTVFLKGTSSQ